jgi:hypothetical protein
MKRIATVKTSRRRLSSTCVCPFRTSLLGNALLFVDDTIRRCFLSGEHPVSGSKTFPRLQHLLGRQVI